MTLGEQIKSLRMQQSMSQEQLAEAVDVTRQSVSKWETGKANPDMDKLIGLANIFGISIAELTGTTEQMNAANPMNTTEQQNAAYQVNGAEQSAVYEELHRMKQKRNHWRAFAFGAIGVLLACVVMGLYLISTYYPSFWQRFGVHTGINENKKTVTFTHNNLYEDGIDGLLDDLGSIIEYPQYLMLQTTFDLRFAPDGTITSIDTMWYGYDERYTYVDSYLITYDAGKSNKITVYFDGGTGDAYDATKDMNVLFDAMRLIPYEKTVADWNQPEYGLLYMGERDWGYNTEGIVYLDRKGNIDIPSNEVRRELIGPTVSVYCPKDDSIVPVRYLFCEDNLKEENVK